MLCLWLGPLRFNCLISFAPLFGYAYCRVLVIVLSPLYELGVRNRYVGALSCGLGICVSWSTLGVGVRFVLPRMFKSSSNFRTDGSRAMLL